MVSVKMDRIALTMLNSKIDGVGEEAEEEVEKFNDIGEKAALSPSSPKQSLKKKYNTYASFPYK